MIFLSGVISHPATPEDETSGNPQQLVWSHGETAVLVVSCKGVGFLSIAACCTWRNNQEPQTSPSLQIANGWKEQRHRQGTKKERNCTTHGLQKLSQIHKKTSWRVSVFVFLSCWTWVLRMRIPHLSLSKHGTWELSISLQVNGPPLIATEHLLWLRPSPHVAKLPSGVPVPVAPISYLQSWRKSSRVNRPTAEVPTLLQRVEYKISNMGSKHPPQLSDPPFIAGQHMLLPPANFSALSGWKACTTLSAKGKANAALPGHSQLWAKLKAASAKHRKQLQCKVFTSQSEIQLDCQQVNKSFPKTTHQNVRLEEAAAIQTT